MGMGGHLTWTAVAKNLEEKKSIKLFPLEGGSHCKSGIFLNNPRFSDSPNNSKKVLFNNYQYVSDGPRVKFKTKEHIIKWTCNKIGLKDSIDLKCEIYLTKEESGRARNIIKLLPKEYVCIEPHSKTSWMKSRIYPFDKYQNIVNALKDKFNFVQIGAPNARKLDNALYTNGDLTFRETYGILKKASFLLSTEGGLVHLANAADTKSFTIYTSYQHPSMTMYPGNTLIDIALYRDEILGFKRHELYEKERNSHDESEIISLIKKHNE